MSIALRIQLFCTSAEIEGRRTAKSKCTCKNQGDKITTKNTKDTKGGGNGNSKLFLFVFLVSFVVHFQFLSDFVVLLRLASLEIAGWRCCG